MQVYAKEAIYDDPWIYCDTRYKIAGAVVWYVHTYGVFPFRITNPPSPSHQLGIRLRAQ